MGITPIFYGGKKIFIQFLQVKNKIVGSVAPIAHNLHLPLVRASWRGAK